MSQRNDDKKKSSWSSGTSPARAMPKISSNMQNGILSYLDGEIQKSNNFNEMKRLAVYKTIVTNLNQNGDLMSNLRDDKTVSKEMVARKIFGYQNPELLKENVKEFRDAVSAGIRATIKQNASDKNEPPAPAGHRMS